jgi:hypothetical protein
MALKWENFAEESFIFKESSQDALAIHVVTLSKQRTSIYPVYDVYPKMHSCIENKFMLRRLLCIMGLFLPPNFTLSSLLRFGSDTGSNPEEDK